MTDDRLWRAYSESLAARAASYPAEWWIPAAISGSGEDALGSVSLLRLWASSGGRVVLPLLLLRRIEWVLDRIDARRGSISPDAARAVQALRAARRRWEERQ